MAKSKPLAPPSLDTAPAMNSEPPEIKRTEGESDWKVVSPKTQFHAPAGIVELDAVVLCAWLDVLRFCSGRMAADLFADNALLKISIMRLRALSVATGQTIADLIADAWTDDNAIAQRDLRALLEILPQFRAPEDVKDDVKAEEPSPEAPKEVPVDATTNAAPQPTDAKPLEAGKVTASPEVKLAPDSAKPEIYGPFPLKAGDGGHHEAAKEKEGQPQELHAAA